MRCPKCGYVSFEYLDSCKKCSKDLFEFKEKAKLSLSEPSQLDLNKLLNAGEAGDTSGVAEGEDIEYNEETSGAEGDSLEIAPSSAEDILSADGELGVDLGVEDEELEIGESSLGEESASSSEVAGLDLTSDDGGIDFDLPFEEEGGLDSTEKGDEDPVDLDLNVEIAEGEGESLDQGGELEIGESDMKEASIDEGEVAGLDLTSDDGGIDFSLPLEEEGEADSLEVGEELDISLDVDTEGVEGDEEDVEQGIELEIDESDLEDDSMAVDEGEGVDTAEKEEELNFSLPSEKGILAPLETGEEDDTDRDIGLEIDPNDLEEDSLVVEEGEEGDTPLEEDEIDFSLPLDEEGEVDSLEVDEELDISLDVGSEETENEGGNFGEEFKLEIDESDLGDSSPTESKGEDELHFSLDMVEKDDGQDQNGENQDDDEGKDEDIEGEIDLLLDDIDDTTPKDS